MSRLEVSPKHPDGRRVPLTAEERADQAARKAYGEAELARETEATDRIARDVDTLAFAADHWDALTGAEKDAATGVLIRFVLTRKYPAS